ncbi:hypothetical protein TWF281_004614 [Arthrobotrys megalospora]
MPCFAVFRLIYYLLVVLTTAAFCTYAYVPSSGCVGPVSSVSRSPGLMDVFAIGSDGKVYTAAWTPRDTSFRGWWHVMRTSDVEVPPCSSVTAISRSRDKLNVFVAGIDGRVFSAAWAQGDTTWHGWFFINAVILPGAHIEAVSRADGKLDLFATGLDEAVWHASYQHGDFASTRWAPIGTLKVSPGSRIGSVSGAENKMDIFVTGADGLVYSSSWEPGLGKFRDWVHIGGRTVPGTPITAVSRSENNIDIFLVGLDGQVWTRGYHPGSTTFGGWKAIGSSLRFPARAVVTAVAPSVDEIHIFATSTAGVIFTTSWTAAAAGWSVWESVHGGMTVPGAPISALSRGAGKIDVFVSGIDAKIGTSAWQTGRTGFGNWASVGGLVGGMTDPEPSRWTEAGIAYWAENTNYSDEAQGITTDNNFWYLSTNTEGNKSIRKIDDAGNLKGVLAPPWKERVHVGAPGHYQGWLYVPLQHPYGVWKVRVDFAAQQWLPVNTTDNRLPMAAVNPLNGRLYTSRFDIQNVPQPTLYAYDRNTMVRRPEDDIILGSTPIALANIQGAVFTDRGRLLLVTSDAAAHDYENYLFVFSARTGYCFGVKKLGNFGSVGSETESVTVRPWHFGSAVAPVHVLELDNDIGTDDFYLHSYSVPFPNLL